MDSVATSSRTRALAHHAARTGQSLCMWPSLPHLKHRILVLPRLLLSPAAPGGRGGAGGGDRGRFSAIALGRTMMLSLAAGAAPLPPSRGGPKCVLYRACARRIVGSCTSCTYKMLEYRRISRNAQAFCAAALTRGPTRKLDERPDNCAHSDLQSRQRSCGAHG